MSLLLQALKKAEQRNVDAVAAKPEDAAVTPASSGEVPAPQAPVFPAIDLQIQADAASSEPIANPVFAQSGLQPATVHSSDTSGLSLLEPSVPEPAVERLQPPRPKAGSTNAAAVPVATNTRPAAARQPGINSQSASSPASSPEALRFMAFKREQLGQKTSRPVARWLALSAVAVALLLFVVYWGMDFFAPAPQLLTTLPPPVPASAPTPIPTTIPAPTTAAAPVVTADPLPSQASTLATAGAGSLEPVSRPVTEQDRSRPVSVPVAAAPDNSGPSRRVAAASATPERPEVSIRKDTVKTGTDELDLAYQELVRGNLSMAERRYRDLLAQDRLNPDIWTGLGAVLMRQSKPEEAESLFRRAQELNPTDPYARAMLLSLSRSPDAYKDSQYTTLAHNASSSSSQAAVFALLAAEHATAKRWNEAQQAFFNALTADPGNPDYAFNLAVTLEHMRQPRLAYDFYRQAIEFAKSKRPSFDLSRAQSRLSALKPAE
ncbi:MAG: tetratricopeptide repeat protein [Burkholderiales bacterium]|nr:tetratricopeptide repeat protein [Burkholderiales bacterium]